MNSNNIPAKVESGSDSIYELFKQINNVPRQSWHEERIVEFLEQFATARGLEHLTTTDRCVVIRKPASRGMELTPAVVLLCHSDMVCVAEEGKVFNPLTDPIESYIDNGWIKACGTSLGADNGIGMSMALSVLDNPELIHGPLECIFTANEEDGMTGAANMPDDLLHGRLIINLDSEDYDAVTIGSAAAYLQFTRVNYDTHKVTAGYHFLTLSINGGRGGHSGVDINKGRSNANKLICKFLLETANEFSLEVARINGGQANNSIPASAEAVVAVAGSRVVALTNRFEAFGKEINEAFKETDPDLVFQVKEMEQQPSQQEARQMEQEVIEIATVHRLMQAIDEIPVGVIEMSSEMKGTVETSNNLGVIATDLQKRELFVSTFARSFIDAEAERVGQQTAAKFRNVASPTTEVHTEVVMFAPGWQGNLSYPLLKVTDESFERVLGFTPSKVAMHFALESGHFIQKFAGCQIVSIGPKIIEPHSVTERVSVATTNDIWRVLIDMLYTLATQSGRQ